MLLTWLFKSPDLVLLLRELGLRCDAAGTFYCAPLRSSEPPFYCPTPSRRRLFPLQDTMLPSPLSPERIERVLAPGSARWERSSEISSYRNFARYAVLCFKLRLRSVGLVSPGILPHDVLCLHVVRVARRPQLHPSITRDSPPALTRKWHDHPRALYPLLRLVRLAARCHLAAGALCSRGAIRQLAALRSGGNVCLARTNLTSIHRTYTRIGCVSSGMPPGWPRPRETTFERA